MVVNIIFAPPIHSKFIRKQNLVNIIAIDKVHFTAAAGLPGFQRYPLAVKRYFNAEKKSLLCRQINFTKESRLLYLYTSDNIQESLKQHKLLFTIN